MGDGRVCDGVEGEGLGGFSDGYRTFDELYRFRMLYHAGLVNHAPVRTVKSWRHGDGALCFGGGWFVVVTELPAGQISNHYAAQHWDLFRVPEVEIAPPFDGHTAADVLDRLAAYVSGAGTQRRPGPSGG